MAGPRPPYKLTARERDAWRAGWQKAQRDLKELNDMADDKSDYLDPMDVRLPCDVTVGHGTHQKGTTLRSLVLRMKVLYKMATGEDADEVAARPLEERQRRLGAFQAACLTPSAEAAPSAAAGKVDVMPIGFADYIKRNYSGEVVFSDPMWHAIRIWRAAMSFASPPPSVQPEAAEQPVERAVALTFDAFRKANVTRCVKWHPEGIDSWSPSDWMTAVTGELGELASLLKMRNRERDGLPGNKFSPSKKQVADELADVLTYLDLLAEVLGVDLGAAVVEKFNEVSERVGFPDRIVLAASPTPASARPQASEPEQRVGLTRLLLALDSLTDPENRFDSAINPGPERDELQRAYNVFKGRA